MRRFFGYCRHFVVVALVCLASAEGLANEVRLPDNLDEVSLVKVGERIFVLHGIQALPDGHNAGMISNTGVVLTGAGVVVVDSGGSYEIGRLIVRKVRELTRKPVVAVFNTHVHGDHWLGNSAIREAFPNVRIYAHEIAIRRLRNGEAQHWLSIISRMVGGETATVSPVLPDAALKGGELIEFGDSSFKVHHTGHAHTDSDIMVEVPGRRLLFTGDIVEYGRAVSSDVPQDFDALGQIEAIRYALALPVDTYVPGHGATGGRDKPQAALRFLETLYGSVKRHYEAGLSDYQMKEKVAADMSEFADWFNFDQLGRLISFVYLQVENASFR